MGLIKRVIKVDETRSLKESSHLREIASGSDIRDRQTFADEWNFTNYILMNWARWMSVLVRARAGTWKV
jgi:hypothetical protein